MNRYLIISIISASILLSGCFKNKAAPHRPVTANSLDQAVELKESVERIILTGQKIGDLPSSLSAMPKLSILLMRGAELKSMDVLSSLPNLETLDISATSLKDLPLSMAGASGLKQLYLADNQLTSFSSKIGDLKKLEYLNLDRNQLTEIPAEIGKCAELRWLRVRDNKIKALPDSVSGLKKLQRIYLKNNQFEAVPPSLRDLPLLEDIDLSGNPVKEFPAWLALSSKIRQLNFDHCQIDKLPADLSKLTGLQGLSLAQCPLPKEEQQRIRKALPDAHVAF